MSRVGKEDLSFAHAYTAETVEHGLCTRPVDWPVPQRVKLLKGKGSEAYRLRVGDYRILYQIKNDILTALVIKIGHRREVYRGI